MKIDVQLKCKCGTMQGVASGLEKSRGLRQICMCDDCQAYAHFLGRANEVLDQNGGTDVYPVAPANLKIIEGSEQLRCVRLSENGMFRWYAGCCKTPIANSMPTYKMPFAGVLHTIMDHSSGNITRDAALGPVAARVQAKYGIGPLPPNSYQAAPLGLILGTLRFLFGAWIKGQYNPSPFFETSTGQPRVEPYILTAGEREGLRMYCGPRKAP